MESVRRRLLLPIAVSAFLFTQDARAGSLSKECGVPDDAGSYSDKRSAYTPMKWISYISTLITCVILVSLKIVHLWNYRRPEEQRQIMRIFLAPVILSTVSLWEVLKYDIALYIDPVANFYETIFLCAIFLLFIQYSAPGRKFGDEMFQMVTDTDEQNLAYKFDWPRITWIFVFQAPVFGLVVVLLTEVTEATNTFCSGSLSPKYGSLWAELITTFSLGAAIGALWKFYQHIKLRVKSRQGLSKVICFKAMVGIRWIQQWIFSILLDHKVLKPTSTFSFADLMFGLPNTISCIEMSIFAVLFWWVCSPREYIDKSLGPALPIWKAVIDSFGFWDIAAGVGRCFTLSMHLKRTGGFKAWREAKAAMKADKKASGQRGGLLGLIPGINKRKQGMKYQEVGSTTDISVPQDYQKPPGYPVEDVLHASEQNYQSDGYQGYSNNAASNVENGLSDNSYESSHQGYAHQQPNMPYPPQVAYDYRRYSNEQENVPLQQV